MTNLLKLVVKGTPTALDKHADYVGSRGEITINPNTQGLNYHDGVTPGGTPLGGTYAPLASNIGNLIFPSWINQTTAVVNFGHNNLNLLTIIQPSLSESGPGNNNFAGLMQPLPDATEWLVSACVALSGDTTGALTGGIFLSDGTKITLFGIDFQDNDISTWDYDTATATPTATVLMGSVPHSFIYLVISCDGTTYSFRYSLNGVTYFLIGSANVGDVLTATDVGFGLDYSDSNFNVGPLPGAALDLISFNVITTS